MYTLQAVQETGSQSGASLEVRAESHRELILQLETSARKYGFEISEYLTGNGPEGHIYKEGTYVGYWKVTQDEMAEV